MIFENEKEKLPPNRRKSNLFVQSGWVSPLGWIRRELGLKRVEVTTQKEKLPKKWR
jgi:hypothetical protein